MNLIAGKTVSIDFESRDKDVLVVPSSITETVVVVSGIDTAIPVAATPSIAGVTFLAFEVPADSEAGTKFFVRMTAMVGGVELSTTKPVGIVGVDIESRLTSQDECLIDLKQLIQGRVGESGGGIPIAIPTGQNYFNCVQPLGYTEARAVEDLYGTCGFENILSDEDLTVEENGLTRHQNALNSFIVDAEQTVAIRLCKFFTPEALIGNQWIWSKTRSIAAYYLSQRRGNEHYFESRYMEALRELDAIATGEIPPPKDIPLSHNSLPSMSNQCVDERFHLHKLRTQISVSVGGTYPGQDTNYHFGFFFGSI